MISSRLRGLRTDDKNVYLQFLPQELTIFEVIQVIFVFIARQILHTFAIGNKFEVKPQAADQDEVFLLPDLRVSMPLKIKKNDLIRYATAIGCPTVNAERVFESEGHLCLMLSAFTQPAFLLLLAHYRSPVRPLGSVNVRNQFDLLRPDLCTAEMLLGTGSFVIQAKLLQETRKVRRGLEIDIEVELAEVNRSVVVFKQIFTMLQFMKFKKGDPIARPIAKKDALRSGEAVSFATEGSATMAWASICKDYNPIHVSDLAAKAFGFPRRLVHGNHAFALALHVLQFDKGEIEARELKKCTMFVNFIRPVVIPSTIEIHRINTDSETTYQLFTKTKLSMTGSITTR